MEVAWLHLQHCVLARARFLEMALPQIGVDESFENQRRIGFKLPDAPHQDALVSEPGPVLNVGKSALDSKRFRRGALAFRLDEVARGCLPQCGISAFVVFQELRPACTPPGQDMSLHVRRPELQIAEQVTMRRPEVEAPTGAFGQRPQFAGALFGGWAVDLPDRTRRDECRQRYK